MSYESAAYYGNEGSHERPSETRKGITAFFVVLGILALLVGGGYFGWQKFGPDSGVAICKEIAKDNKVGGSKNDPNDKLTEKEYKQIREAFQDSRDPEIKQHGTALIDAFWQVSQLKDGEEMGALMFVGTITSAYSGLTGACAKHDVTIPPMSGLNDEK